ncbi:hypothetical protein ICL81_06635 [Leucobacter sp. cx-328]|uniref:hypothetical protein n=1 Tax=unclassified Leucobacter TaxID=2621730 RepID=UPI00165DD501|nr:MULTISPECIES: hypothetical protein [unclassified Leucobacter]MBC9944189.1 hypothetical protein [Leucobacter sp. cx-328]
MGMKFLKFCLAVLAGIIVLYLAFCLLAQFWVGIVAAGLVIFATWLGILVWRWRRGGW